ncbi:hypothetical protein [Emticicia sp. 21SJ11W-3]|uniref:hypothetical protein n=1 Tax=Emticicia sp. 21SJ11W-3 TaxID=2916755 RepID=UPI00209D227A|nr:hypothetical protein [Emticicia sp. 21SJ11W-3]UTA66513.1 hypothetical protein MB380_12980 [Emticicia sp. 21SJ11W-3]
MIKIEFKENHENRAHEDSIIEFPTLGKKLIGDTFWFAVDVEPEISYEKLIQNIVSEFLKDFNAIKKLSIKRSYMWFFHTFDEGDHGVVLTNMDNFRLKLSFVFKFRGHPQEYSFQDEEYLLEREPFLIEMEKEINKYLV